MLLKVSSPEGILFEGKIKQITLPTENGAITILPENQPLVSVIKPGIIECIPENNALHSTNTNEFIFNKDKFSISISKGFVFTDGKVVTVTTTTATKTPGQPLQKLQTMKEEYELQLKKLKNNGSIEEIQDHVIKIEKINADIKLSQLSSLRV